jgi:hypothetical protein
MLFWWCRVRSRTGTDLATILPCKWSGRTDGKNAKVSDVLQVPPFQRFLRLRHHLHPKIVDARRSGGFKVTILSLSQHTSAHPGYDNPLDGMP